MPFIRCIRELWLHFFILPISVLHFGFVVIGCIDPLIESRAEQFKTGVNTTIRMRHGYTLVILTERITFNRPINDDRRTYSRVWIHFYSSTSRSFCCWLNKDKRCKRPSPAHTTTECGSMLWRPYSTFLIMDCVINCCCAVITYLRFNKSRTYIWAVYNKRQ